MFDDIADKQELKNSGYYFKILNVTEDVNLSWSAEIEHEKRVAIFDLIESNSFKPQGLVKGPYSLNLSIIEGRLLFDIEHYHQKTKLALISVPMRGLQRVIREYLIVCENYYTAIKKAPPDQIEAIDVGRRALHDEGSDSLQDYLSEHILVDRDTARRLFTLLSVLHIKK